MTARPAAVPVAVPRSRDRDRALARAVASGVAVRVLGGALTVLSVALAARSLGRVHYGVLATLTASTGLLAFADLGIGNGLMTRLAAAHGRDDLAGARAVVSAGLAALLALGAAVVLGGLVLAALLPWPRILGAPQLPAGQLRPAAALFFGCVGLAVPAGLGQRVQLGLERGAAANGWLLAGAALSLPAVGLCAAAGAPLWCFVLACTGTPALVAAAQTAWVLGRGHVPLRPARALVTRDAMSSLSRLSGLFLVLNMAVAVAFQSDAVIVAAGLGAASAATFAVGLRLFGALGSVLAGASQQLWTAVAGALACGDVAWARARVVRVVGLTLAAALPLAGLLVVAGGPLARVWLGEAFVPSRPLLAAFAVWTVYWLLMTQLSYVLSAAEIVGPQVVMAVVMAALNVVVSVWLTARIGITGPLLGSLASHLLCSGVPSALVVARLLRRDGDATGAQ